MVEKGRPHLPVRKLNTVTYWPLLLIDASYTPQTDALLPTAELMQGIQNLQRSCWKSNMGVLVSTRKGTDKTQPNTANTNDKRCARHTFKLGAILKKSPTINSI
jgi:hypothetical protein